MFEHDNSNLGKKFCPRNDLVLVPSMLPTLALRTTEIKRFVTHLYFYLAPSALKPFFKSVVMAKPNGTKNFNCILFILHC
jgi:hypothetical protein